ncbi:helix-turn-helix domain-containing protein [Paenibacillus puerhi]|uniref:helix-turn-helix domain-containing protein n=1 Tax=Paenibacillus puerhi TaxID=2692622 RepID=UPI00135CE985|nr:helix-turn-helix domain-containing protein [Paenibacillus puerhi]
MTIQIPKPHMGLLHVQESAKRFHLTRHAPSRELASFVKHYWIVKWNLTGQEAYSQLVVPNPCVNLVVEPGKTAFYAPGKTTYAYLLHGQGCVFGVKFKPGGFYPFIKQPISELTGRPLGVNQVLDASGSELEKAILKQEDEARMAEQMERYLLPKLPDRDAQTLFVQQVVDLIAKDREITKVDTLCEHFQVHKRTLQRLFDQYVGVSPKWVIRLSRIQNAAEAMDSGQHHHDLLQLSMDLGYHDQAHFIKDFKSMVGKTPDEYAKGSR